MKHNLTLSLEKEVIKKARILAARRRTSITRMLGQELKRIVDDAEEYERSKKRALAHLKSGFHLGGKITASRDELHER